MCLSPPFIRQDPSDAVVSDAVVPVNLGFDFDSDAGGLNTSIDRASLLWRWTLSLRPCVIDVWRGRDTCSSSKSTSQRFMVVIARGKWGEGRS